MAGFFDRGPVRRSFFTMTRDSARHLVIQRLRRCDKANSTGTLFRQAQRKAALAGARTAQNEYQF
jgi:hypothetical protein